MQQQPDVERHLRAIANPPAPDEIPERPPLRERMLSLADLANLTPPQPLVADLLDLDSVAIAYGRRGGGKSFVAVDLTISVATGTRWLGRPVERVPVLYIVGEGAAGLHQRYDAWMAERGAFLQTPSAEQLLILPEPVNLLDPSSVGLFANEAVEMGARFIVFDTLARCMVGGDENSAKDAGLAVEQLDVIRRRTGACVLVVHHTGKNAEQGARGSSAFEAAADTVLEVATTDALMTITCTKQKNHAEPNPIRLKMRPVRDSVVLDLHRDSSTEVGAGELKTLAALSEMATTEGLPAGKWEAASGVGVSTFYRHLKKLSALGLLSVVGTEKRPRYLVSDAGALMLSQHSHDSHGSAPNTTPTPGGLRPLGVRVTAESETTPEADLEPF